MKLLVCGGRDYEDWTALSAVLSAIVPAYDIKTIIHGDARGADRLAKRWAIENGLSQIAYPADWGRYGKPAGMIRNRQMLKDGKPDYGLAFPGGAGTAGMVGLMKKAGLQVMEVLNSYAEDI